MKFGYARVSTNDQNTDLQVDSLHIAGCDEIITEKISSRFLKKPQWEELLGKLRKGDQLIVYKLDRLARSARDLLSIVESLSQKKVDLISIHEPWVNTNNAAGKMIITVMAGIAEFERELIRQRTNDGRAAAMKRGVKFGRPAKLNGQQRQFIVDARNNGASVSELAATFSVSRDTIYRSISSAGQSAR